ncbi:MAG: protein-L-isoaspartate(D-aspartate) O-methyltransferase [Myxococcales bacterium]|nr:protein-L-isoaspartate(D-aspartate) O-methyltransferase [Myxococcales bacterium]
MVERVAALMAATAPETGVAGLAPGVRRALSSVPRDRFVPKALRGRAYENVPLPIGHDQTISQPFIVALMTQLAEVEDAKVLEIGTGCGYQAAILGELAREVYSIEVVPALARSAAARLAELGYQNVTVRLGDGFDGWPEHAPYDAILVTAATPEPPAPLLDQLAIGGRMVVPLGGRPWAQELAVLRRNPDGEIEARSKLAVAFVPLVRGGD